MKTLRTIAILALALSFATTAQAQDLKTANFLDNYLYGYRLNPSVRPQDTAGFVGFGNVWITPETNFGLSNLLFPLEDGRLVTGLNSAISSDVFPGGLEEMSRVSAHINANILAIGTSGKKGSYGHFEINLVSENEIGVPRTLFEAFKTKNTTGSYKVENLNFHTTDYLELAYGRTKRKRDLAIGWTAKALVGLARVNAAVDMAINTAGDNMWVQSQGTLQAAVCPFFSIGLDNEGYYDPSKLTVNPKGIKPAGFGGAVDIGASYYLLRDRLILGAAVRNLGVMKWTDNLYGQTSGSKVYINMDDSNMGDTFTDMIKFKPVEGSGSGKMEMLPFSFNLSAKFKPFEFITVGAVGTVYNYSGYATKDIRLGAALTPFRQLNIAGTYSFGDQGSEVGLAASVRLLGISVYAGVDAIQMKVSPQYIPLDPVCTTVNAGVGIAFGKSSPAAAKQKAEAKAAAKEKKEAKATKAKKTKK